MRTTKWKHRPRVYATTFLGTLFFVGVIMFFIFGGVDFGRKYPKVLNYENSICRVDTINYQKYDCHARYSTYTCYGPIWDAHYGPNLTIYAKVETESRYPTSFEALNKAKDYQIGMSYSCWYDTRNPSVAQWDKPSVLTQIILLSFGGLSVLLCILFCFVTYRFVREAKLQREHASFYSYSYPVN